jgi:oligopeptide/dipeptide ABC transporter ATP-binding protein
VSVLEVKGLTTELSSSRLGTIRTLDGLDLTLEEGEILGVVGETAAGKSVLLRIILGLLHEGERILDGEVVYRGEKLPITSDEAMRRYRSASLSLIQSGQRARLDPVRRIGDQLVDVMRTHGKIEKDERPGRARHLIEAVGIPAADVQLRAYPHELSGGMCQRVVIALALANRPDLLMADEPTAGLDVTIQVQILDLFRDLVAESGAASILATRDLAQVAHYCSRVVILRGGKTVETADVGTFFAGPRDEYSAHLLRMAAAARGEETDGTAATGRSGALSRTPETLLEVRDLVKHFKTARHTVHAVNGVTFGIDQGRTLGLVGESGSGKTTIGRCIAGLIHPTAGEVVLGGQELGHISTRKRSKRAELETHVVFQEPRESLNPRWSLGTSIEEPLRYQGKLDRQQRARRVLELLDLVGLTADFADLYPHQTTAGVQQRVATARAIAVHPKLVILDEPTFALDMSVKVQMIDLLIRLQEELGISYLFISHDLTAVKMIAHEIAIMYLGRIVEYGPAADVFQSQLNPYGRALLSSVLYPDPSHERSTFRLEGEIPSPIDLPRGCHLAGRCPLAEDRCRASAPALEPAGGAGRASACFRTDEIVAAGGPEALRAATRETPVIDHA